MCAIYTTIISWNTVVKHSSVTLVHGDSRDAERQEGQHGELDPHAAANTACPAMQRVPVCRLFMYALVACRKGRPW